MNNYLLNYDMHNSYLKGYSLAFTSLLCHLFATTCATSHMLLEGYLNFRNTSAVAGVEGREMLQIQIQIDEIFPMYFYM